MLNQWRRIPEFPDYSVSDQGTVRNDDTGRKLTLLVNQRSIVHVGLTHSKIQYKRSVSRLVAEAFIENYYNLDSFDSIINLNGNRLDNAATNLAWRPRWFAIKYYQELNENLFDPHAIQELTTGERFKSTRDAVMRYGIFEEEILASILKTTRVWPTGHRFGRV